MASVARADLSKTEHDELCCVYAALILHDEDVEITVILTQSDKILKIVTASGNNIEKYWPTLFAKALKGQNITGLLGSVGSGSVSAGPAVVSQPTAAKAEEPKVEAKKEEKDDDDALAGGIGFGDDDEWQLVIFINLNTN